MKIAYGYNGVDEDEELYHASVEAGHYFDETAVFGAWLVDFIPICRY